MHWCKISWNKPQIHKLGQINATPQKTAMAFANPEDKGSTKAVPETL